MRSRSLAHLGCAQRWTLFAVIALGVAMPVAADQVDSLRPLLIEAIDQGVAEGELTSPPIRAFYQREFGTDAQLEIRVRRLAVLPSPPGCARLEVVTRQAGVIDRNATRRAEGPADLSFRYQIDFCRDGSMPDGGDR